MAEKCMQPGCKNYANTDDLFCFFHSPNKVKQRAEAQRKGGLKALSHKLKILEESNVELKSSEDVLELLGETINQVRVGKIEVKIANCVGYLCGIALQAIDKNYEQRLEAVEAKVFQKQTWE